MKNILNNPKIYQAYQVLGGFHAARIKAFNQYVDLNNVKRIFDIGCGPGHFSETISKDIDYIGFDTDQNYIDYANKHFGGSARFFNRIFDKTAIREFGNPDLIIMNGVLHHLNDETFKIIASDAAASLNKNGILYTLDGCYTDNQNIITKFLLDNDRGGFVRNSSEYNSLLKESFNTIESDIRNDLSILPYTFILIRSTNK